jgi:hypothetical protein
VKRARGGGDELEGDHEFVFQQISLRLNLSGRTSKLSLVDQPPFNVARSSALSQAAVER